MLANFLSNNNRFIKSLPPGNVLIVLVFSYLIIWYVSIQYLTQTPWSGLSIKSDAAFNGWMLSESDAFRNSFSIIGLSTGDLNISTEPMDLNSDPEVFETYGDFNRFMQRQDILSQFFSHSIWQVATNAQDSFSVELRPSRPISTLGLGFWVNFIAGFICLMVSVSIWLIKRGKPDSFLVLLGGLGLAVTGITAAIYSSRDIALPAFDFRILHAVNRLSVTTFAASMVSLLWIQPIKLGSVRLVPFIFGWQWLLWLNETVQFIEWPFHAYYPMQMFIPLAVAMALIVVQWQHSKNRALERAQLLWFFISLMLSSGSAIFLYAAPVVIGVEPFVPLWLGNVFILTIYLGFVLGIMRFRLFDVQRWWVKSWFWLGVIVAVLLVDAALIFVLKLQSDIALGISLLIVMWVYIPLRNLIWDKLVGIQLSNKHQSRTLEKMLDIFESTDQDPHTAFRSWMINYFNPAELEHTKDRINSPQLIEHGLQIITPGLNTDSWSIKGKNKGMELFDMQDIKMISLFWKINSHALNLINTREESELRERKRIMRDLHDDVGAKLLTLVHTCKEPSESNLARNTLQLLRQTVLSLRENNSKNILDALIEWKSEIQSRFDIAGISLIWDNVHEDSPRDFTAREFINLSKIMREAVNNVLRHANATEVKVNLTLDVEKLIIIMENDGTFTDPSSWEPGTGLENIRTRAAEIGASVKWQIYHYGQIQRLQFHCKVTFGESP